MKKMKWLAYLMVPFLAIAISCKDDDEDDDNNNNGGNTEDGRNEAVMVQIANSNLAEVILGRLADTLGTDSLVKGYGEMMAEEHQTAQDDLDSLAENRNVDLPANLSVQHQNLRDSLNGLSGMAFDSAYIQSQIQMHTQTRDLFESIADTTEDQTLENYVNKYLPDIEMHLVKADSIAEVLGINVGGNGGGNDTTGVGNDTTGVGNDTTGAGNDTTGVGNDTTGVGNDTTGAGNDTSGAGNDTSAGMGRNYNSSAYIRRR